MSGGGHAVRLCPPPSALPTAAATPFGSAKLGCMGEFAADIGRKAIAVAVLLVAVWLLFKFVIGVVAAVAWIAVVVLALVAVVWAVGVLR